MSDRPSFLNKTRSVLERNPDYAWLSKVSPDSVESLHKLCDEAHRSLLGGPLFDYAKADWARARQTLEVAQKYVEYAERSERVGMLTVLTGEGTLRHGEVIVRLASAVVHNRDKGSLISKFFNPSGGVPENCKRVGFAFLELIAERSENSQSLPWDPTFPLEMLKTL